MDVLDYNQVEKELKKMTPRSILFHIVKKEMVKRGHWKNKPRGKVVLKNLK